MFRLVPHLAVAADQAGEPFVLSVSGVFAIELFVQRGRVLVFVQRDFDFLKVFTQQLVQFVDQCDTHSFAKRDQCHARRHHDHRGVPRHQPEPKRTEQRRPT